MKSHVFDYSHYRDYLQVRLSTTGANRGLRSKLAEKTNTQPAFISRVLGGDNDLSAEHIPPTNEFLGHTFEESHYFALLVFHARAGTPALKKYYKEQIDEIIAKRSVFLERVKITQTVQPADQGIYYSKWYYIAIHVLVSIEEYRTREAISQRLQLSLGVVSKAIEELVRMGLIENKNGKILIGKKRIHIDKNSPWIAQMHTNFRTQAIQKIVTPEEKDMHFSLGISMSKKLYDEYRSRFIDLVTEFEKKMQEDEPEELYTLNIDLFKSQSGLN